MNPSNSFGHWLRVQRRANDLTQNELARRVYCAEVTIRKIEAGTLRPSRELTAQLIAALEQVSAEQRELLRWARER